MFYSASAFDQDLDWCVDDGVNLDYAFSGTLCASTSCGVTQADDVANCPTPAPTFLTQSPTAAPTYTTALPTPKPTSKCSAVAFAWKQDIQTGGTNYKRVKAADIDGDGDAADLVVIDSTPTLAQYLWWFAADTSAGTLTANQITAYAALKNGIDIALGDIDDDGDEDIVVVGTLGQEIQWYSNSGDGSSFTKMNNYIDKDIAAPVTVYAAAVSYTHLTLPTKA